MILLPVIERELRAEARSTFTYWLRVVGGISLLGAGVLAFLEAGQAQPEGKQLFSVLHLTLFGAIWIVVPLMTADCISREKREGTLGLLFLTPLRAFEVVLAKGLAHGLRAMALCLAAVPVLVVPFLLGGVGWKEALVAVLVDFSAFCLALGAGLLASAWNKSMTWAMGWAEVLAGLLALGLLLFLGVLLAAMVVLSFPNPQLVGNVGWNVLTILSEPGELIQWVARNGPTGGGGPLFVASAALALLSLVGLLGLVFLAAVGVRRHAHERPRSVAREKLEQQLCTPAFGVGVFRWWMRRLLQRNPMGWLERRTWQSRLVTWGWLTVLVILYSSVASGASSLSRELNVMHLTLAWLLVGNAALSASGSLRRERETGVMELLLISPLAVGQIISGRLRGLWGQFLPTGVLLLGLWAWLLYAFFGASVYRAQMMEELTVMGLFGMTLLTLPVVGLYYSMRCRLLVAAFFCTAVVGVGLPALLALLFAQVASDRYGTWSMTCLAGWAVLAGLGAASLAAWPLRGLKALSFTSAGALLLACVGGIVLWVGGLKAWNAAGPLPLLLVFAVLQIGIAVALGTGLRQLLECRRFTLPG